MPAPTSQLKTSAAIAKLSRFGLYTGREKRAQREALEFAHQIKPQIMRFASLLAKRRAKAASEAQTQSTTEAALANTLGVPEIILTETVSNLSRMSVADIAAMMNKPEFKAMISLLVASHILVPVAADDNSSAVKTENVHNSYGFKNIGFVKHDPHGFFAYKISTNPALGPNDYTNRVYDALKTALTSGEYKCGDYLYATDPIFAVRLAEFSFPTAVNPGNQSFALLYGGGRYTTDEKDCFISTMQNIVLDTHQIAVSHVQWQGLLTFLVAATGIFVLSCMVTLLVKKLKQREDETGDCLPRFSCFDRAGYESLAADDDADAGCLGTVKNTLTSCCKR